MARSPQKLTPRIVNKKARFDFELLEKYEAGIALTGSEVKSLRAGKASLEGAYAFVRDGELWLLDCHIAPYPQAGYAQHLPTRERKLLLHRREIRRLESRVTQKGLTVVPLAMYFNDRGLVKVQLALARGKTHADKRAALKEREQRREIERTLRRH